MRSLLCFHVVLLSGLSVASGDIWDDIVKGKKRRATVLETQLPGLDLHQVQHFAWLEPDQMVRFQIVESQLPTQTDWVRPSVFLNSNPFVLTYAPSLRDRRGRHDEPLTFRPVQNDERVMSLFAYDLAPNFSARGGISLSAAPTKASEQPIVGFGAQSQHWNSHAVTKISLLDSPALMPPSGSTSK